jgi:hypothetical protein
LDLFRSSFSGITFQLNFKMTIDRRFSSGKANLQK